MGQITSISYGTDVQEKAKGKQNHEVEASSPKCLVTIRYEGWGKEWDETVPYPNNRLSRMFTYTKKVKCFVTMLGGQKHSPSQTGSAELMNIDPLNWTKVWPCVATFRMPHPGQANTSAAFACLRGQGSRIFIRPYLAYMLPKTVQRRMVHGGHWVDGGKILSWKELDLNNSFVSSSGNSILRELPPAGVEVGAAAGTAYCFVHNFYQAYRAARSDWIKGHLPPNAVWEGALLRDEYRVRNVGGDAIDGVRYSGSFDIKKVEVKEVKVNEVGKNSKKCSVPTTTGEDKRESNQGCDANAFAKSENSAHLPAMKVPFVPAPSLPPAIPINDLVYPDQGVRRLADSNRWASILRVGATDIFLGSYTSQSEAAYAVNLALVQSERENCQIANGKENSSRAAPLMPHLPNFQVHTSPASNAGRIADLFNTPIESIVSAFEKTQAEIGQDTPPRLPFRLRDWMDQHYRHMQHLKELSPMGGQDAGDQFTFVANVKDDSSRRKRRKQSTPKRLRVPPTDGKHNSSN